MIDKQVRSAAEIDFSGLIFPVIYVYRSSKEYPGCYVARLFDVGKPTNIILVRESLQELQQDIKEHTDMTFMENHCRTWIGEWI